MSNTAMLAAGVFGVVALTGLFAFAADAPKGKADGKAPAKAETPATAPAFHVSEIIIKNVKAKPAYLYAEAKTTIPKMSETAKTTFGPLADMMTKGKVTPKSGPIFVYLGMSNDPEAEFTVRMGVPVEEGTKAPEGHKVAKLDGFKCVSVYYTGSLQNLGKGFDAMWLKAAGATHAQMVEVVRHASTDGEVCDWVRNNVKKSAAEKALHRQDMLGRPTPDDPAAQERLKKRKQDAGLAHRDDIESFVDFIDADEKRI